jgi:hypothetical protein
VSPARDDVLETVKAKIMAMAPLFQGGGLPFKSIGKKGTEKYLTRLIKLVWELKSHIIAMPLEARKTLPPPFPGNPETFSYDLLDMLAWPAVEALKIIRKETGRKGPRDNRTAHYAAYLVAETYEETAGRPPTVEEEQELLEYLFPELGIDANPEHYVRVRRREMKKEVMQKR